MSLRILKIFWALSHCLLYRVFPRFSLGLRLVESPSEVNGVGLEVRKKGDHVFMQRQRLEG